MNDSEKTAKLLLDRYGIRYVMSPHGWRDGRVAEGGGLLNRYTVKSRIEGSNPSVSASCLEACHAGFAQCRGRLVPRHNAPQGEG